ncbi:hypothetical protein BH11GEM2_BH11GEM2_40640 [soil metagenome]
MSNPLRFYAYASSATVAFPPEDLVELLRVSRANNERDGVTGLLLYRGGNFLQALEGPAEAVQRTVERIARDARHHSITVLLEIEAEERLFGDWNMAFEELSLADSERPPGASAYLQRGAGADATTDHSDHDVFEFFRSFREYMR